jgi:hypothetical protein
LLAERGEAGCAWIVDLQRSQYLTQYLLVWIAEQEAVARRAAAGKYIVQPVRTIVASDPLP